MTPKNLYILSAVLGGMAVGLHFVSKSMERKQRARREEFFAAHKAHMDAIKEWADQTNAALDKDLETLKFWKIVADNDL